MHAARNQQYQLGMSCWSLGEGGKREPSGGCEGGVCRRQQVEKAVSFRTRSR